MQIPIPARRGEILQKTKINHEVAFIFFDEPQQHGDPEQLSDGTSLIAASKVINWCSLP